MRRFAIFSLVAFLACALAFAQSNASNKAVFAKGGGITISTLDRTCTDTGFDPPTEGALCSTWVPLFTLDDVIKTSSVGALEAAVSLECALWTYNTVTATTGGGKQASSSRAALEVQVLIDGRKAEPRGVIFCDRVQAVGLTVTCSPSCTTTDTITLELFERTKNANSFHYFAGPLLPILHDVQVRARGLVACYSTSGSNPAVPIACPAATLDAYEDAKTAVAIGKATLVVEEHNNFRSFQ